MVGVSNWISEEAQKSLLKDKKHFVIHNGIDTELFVNTPSNMKEELIKNNINVNENINEKYFFLEILNIKI